MKRILLMAALCCAGTFIVRAQNAVPLPPDASDGGAATNSMLSVKRARYQARVAAMGGIVIQKQESDVIRVVNAQKRVGGGLVESVAAALRRTLMVPVEVGSVESPKEVFTLVQSVFKNPKTRAAILLVENADTPALLAAPEEGWAVVNIAKLTDDLPPEEVLERRVRREFWRACAYALNGTQAAMQPCLLTDVKNVNDLDALRTMGLSPQTVQNISNGARSRGIKPIRRVPYARAVKEGWAPAPTNDAQRAVWEKVKSGGGGK